MKKTMLAALLGFALVPALAQETAPVQGDHGHAESLAINHGGRVFIGNGAIMDMRGKAVKNAPYAATVVLERQQALADGNQIVRKTTSMSYRDSEGRTREEIRDEKGELRHVTITDPVAHTTYLLRPQDKTANKIAVNPEMARAAAEAARERIAQLRKEGKLPAVERRSGEHGEEVIVKRVERHEGNIQQEVQVRVEKALGDRMAAREMSTRIGTFVAGAAGDMKWAAKAATKDLGTRDINGLKAEGKLRSYEIPAGEIGNRDPIVVSDESWYSPELQVTLYTKHSDPRSGETVYRLENVKREQPAAALFTVPADYTVKDMLANVKRKLEQKGQ